VKGVLLPVCPVSARERGKERQGAREEEVRWSVRAYKNIIKVHEKGFD